MTTKTMSTNRARSTTIPDAAGNFDAAGLYRLAALTLLISVGLIVLDMAISAILPGGDAAPGARDAAVWFGLFQTDPYYALRDLGLFNIFNIILSLPLLLALYHLHRHDPAARLWTQLGLLVSLLGGAIYIANNTVLPLYALSNQYAAATTDAQRVTLLAAGEALLARGADFTLGSLTGFVVSSLGTIIVAAALLRGHAFGWITPLAGVLGLTALLIFTVWVTLLPDMFNTAMLLAFPGGILALVWNIGLIRRLFQLAGAG